MAFSRQVPKSYPTRVHTWLGHPGDVLSMSEIATENSDTKSLSLAVLDPDAMAWISAARGLSIVVETSPAVAYVRSKSPSSRPSIISALRQVLAVLDPDPARLDWRTFPYWRLTWAETSAIQAALARRHRPSTARRAVVVMRRVLHTAWRLGLMSHEAMASAADLDPIRGERIPAGRAVEAVELAALWQCCHDDRTITGRRDAATVALLVGAGLRRQECSTATVADWDAGHGHVRVVGKFDKQREVAVASKAARYVDDWLSARERAEVRPADPAAPLILGVRRGGHLTVAPISGHGINDLLGRRAARAGLAMMTAHDLRRTYVSEHLDHGTPIELVQRNVGHASVTTTATYDRRGDRARHAVADAIDPGLTYFPPPA